MIDAVLCALFIATASAAVPKDGRIINGAIANPGQFPYQVGLQINTPAGGTWCGGCLISNRWILTAGHCTLDALSLVATLGSTNRNSARQIIHVTRAAMITHPQYDPKILRNDIALISIPPVPLSSEVMPIALENDASASHVNTLAIASGWGLTSDNSGVSPTLNYATVQVIDNRLSAPFFPDLVTNNNICIATTAGSTTCKGDSGGPLAIIGPNNQYILIGLTSFGSGETCLAGIPACFTRVGAYREWIREQTGI